MSVPDSSKVRPVARPRNISNLNKGASLDDGLENVTINALINCPKKASASLDNLMSVDDETLTNTDLSSSLDQRYMSIPRMQAPPRTDDADEYLLVHERTAPLSMIDDDLNDLGDVHEHSIGGSTFSNYRDSERVVFMLSPESEVTLEMPVTPIEMLPWHDAMQNSVKIEPSPERTLERQKKSRDDTDGHDTDGLFAAPTTRHRPVDPQITEQKLNTFFGEEKEGFTDLESSVYKVLIHGSSAARVRHESGNSQDVAKLKKASTSSYLASRLTNLQASTNQLKTAKKVLDREQYISKSKDSKAWRGIVSRKFKRHTTSPSSDPSEDGSVATFGVPLDVCPTSKSDAMVPLIVEVCVHVVDELGSNCQGIYRVPGHSGSVSELVDEVNHGDPAYIKTGNERWSDVNVVSSLLKLFFRKLPESLTTDHMYEPLIATIRSAGNYEKSALRLKRLLRELPEQNFATLRYLIEHLARIAAHQASNKMDAHNLAMMFGPSLVRPTEESMMNMVKDIDDQSAVIERLILQPNWYFGDWTEDAEVPVFSRPIEHSTSGSSNLQLLANAESLVAQMAQDAASSSQADDSPSFFKLGSHRQSRKNKNKADKEANELDESSGLPDLNRDVELRRARIVLSPQKPSSSMLQPPETKSKELSPGLTRADLARKVSISLKNKKVKRRYTERPTVNDIRIMYDHPEAVIKNKTVETDKDSSRNEKVLEQLTKAAPKSKDMVKRELPEIKRYPAYNFVDTTIKLSSSSSFKKIPSNENFEPLQEGLSHSYSTMSLLPHTKSKPRAFDAKKETQERMEDWLPPTKGGNNWSEAVDGSRGDEDVFHSTDLIAAQGYLPSSSSSTAVASVESRFHTIGSPYRNKRFSETDASRYFQGVGDNNFDLSDGFQSSIVHKYDVVIRAPEGRRYYVLTTDRPSVLFEKSKRNKLNVESKSAPRPPLRFVETLPVNQVIMARMDQVSAVCVEASDRVRGREDIDLYRRPSLYACSIDSEAVTSA